MAGELVNQGLEINEFQTAYKNIGYSLHRTTIGKWVSKSNNQEPIYTEDDKRGKKQLLHPEQIALFVGFVIHENEEGNTVDREAVQKFLRESLGIPVALRTISTYLKEEGLVLRTVASRPLTKVKTLDDYKRLYYQWLLDKHAGLAFEGPRKDMASIDFMSNSRRLERNQSFSPKGLKQPKRIALKVKYTDTYLTFFMGRWKE